MRKVLTTLLALSALLVTGCAATSFESTWKEPGAGPAQIDDAKFVAIAMAPDSARRPAEEAIVNQFAKYGAQGTPSYRIVDIDAPKEELKSKLEAEGFKAAVIVKLLKEDKELRSTNTGMYYGMGAPYDPFWGYGWGWGMYSAPEIRTDTLVYLETLVYSVADDKLIWAARSKTTNPTNLEKFMSEVVDGVVKQMKKDGLLVE